MAANRLGRRPPITLNINNLYQYTIRFRARLKYCFLDLRI
jgi:hypothetical protein